MSMSHEDEKPNSVPFTQTNSIASSLTHVPSNEKSLVTPELPSKFHAGHGESALPDDKVEEAIENIEGDWENDPENARNWSLTKKWTAVSIVALYTFVSPLASSMMAPGLPEVAQNYGITNSSILALTLSIFLLSFAIGPLIFAPLSEMYGRTWVLHIANIFTMGFSLGCAFAPTTGALIGFRFLSGLSGSAPIAIGGGSIGDMFSERDRASAMAIYSLGPLIGPVVGPIAGGFIAQTIGIKWVFIVIAITCGVASVLGIPLLKETYAPVIRVRRDARKGIDPEIAAKLHPHLSAAHGNKWNFFVDNLSRPIIMLFRSLVCFMLSLYMAFMYGIYYLMFTTFADLFHDTYGFSAGIGGLAYLGLGIGFLCQPFLGQSGLMLLIDTQLASKNGGVGTPEMRIPALSFGSLFVPIGLLWYGWSAAAKIHWIMPIIGSGIYGFGMMAVFLPIQLYLVDAFTFGASAISAAAFFRSLFGFVFPLFGQQMFDRLGLGGGNSLLAGLGIVLGIPFPIFLYYKGAQLRARNPLTRKP
ncbi:hypothetical protein K443DRAFT_8895 [Laccaria amethystina LaAM-08-1]|uniref:Major facilitator superfamily (MFS) profile domain-containing protein n=1 Tax=Laccaria amethystina LaAM-08-1 TaxID=1095629 RepID=A0A0C9XS82_9AGAR|nr:hypothetical protein K443DRAFT_8895 [Laccaria amethystina LaAM-08-1]